MSQADSAFTGKIPELYDRLMGPMLFQPYAAEMARRLQWLVAGHVLETAAGTGIVTRAMEAALPPTVTITATDLNQPMLDHAAAQPGTARVVWQQADAQSLPFPAQAFDAVVCQFGVMFFPDKAAGYREALRVLKPGGRLLFSVWGPLELSPIADTVQKAVAAQFPADPPQFVARTPHGYNDVGAINAALEAAGFTAIEAERRVERSHAVSSMVAATAFCQGTPLRGEIVARDPSQLGAVTDAAAQALADRFGGGAIDAPIAASMEAIIVSATRPGS
jgi:ubiquinone/menaquinone biosynthesis C-methylase UbiE